MILLADYNELLPHSFMAEVTRSIVVHDPDARVLDALERNLANGDNEVQNVVSATFVENLEPEDEPVRATLGLKLRTRAAESCECAPDTGSSGPLNVADPQPPPHDSRDDATHGHNLRNGRPSSDSGPAHALADTEIERSVPL